jgi:hypothetical protein
MIFKFEITFTNFIGAICLIYSIYQNNAACAGIAAGLMGLRKLTDNIKINVNK